MKPDKKDNEEKKNRTYNKPISLRPLTFDEALAALLKTKPMPKEEEPSKPKKESGKES